MATAKMLTDAELGRRLTAARDAERKARSRIAKLKRASAGVSRRAEMQRLCTLGRAVMVWSSADERFMQALRRYLNGYISRETDREILAGTPWEVPARVVVEAPHG